MCLDEQLQVRGASTVEIQQSVVQKLLLSEARIVLVLYGERSWLDFIKAINNEMVKILSNEVYRKRKKFFRSSRDALFWFRFKMNDGRHLEHF